MERTKTMPRKTWHVPVMVALIVVIVVLLFISLFACSVGK